jgi:hypothetical protein
LLGTTARRQRSRLGLDATSPDEGVQVAGRDPHVPAELGVRDAALEDEPVHARPVGGKLTRTREAAEVAWVAAADLEGYDIHPAIRLRLAHGLSAAKPHVG